MSLLAQTLALLVGVVLVVAAFGKADAWRTWRKKTRTWFGSGFTGVMVRRALPLSEMCVAVLCFVRPPAGLMAAAALFAVLAGGAVQLSLRHRGEACGCFGALMPSRIGWSLAIRNCVAAATAAGAAAMAQGEQVSAADWHEVVVTAFVGVLVLASAEFNQMKKSQGGLV